MEAGTGNSFVSLIHQGENRHANGANGALRLQNE